MLTQSDLKLNEINLYGSSRLGMRTVNELITALPELNTYPKEIYKGKKFYELSNHLGNVLSVVSDRLFSTETSSGSGVVDFYSADLVSSSDYYPFGMAMVGRKFNTPAYRFGFNGKEKDEEFTNSASHYDFGARIYDSRLGRFLSIDPKYRLYTFMSSYCYAANNPIIFIDDNGEGPIVQLLRILMTPIMAVSSWTDLCIMVNQTASASAGLGVFFGAGAAISRGVAIDPKGNIGMILSAGAFGDLFSALGGVGNGVKEGNTTLGAQATAMIGVSLHDKKSLLDFGGKSLGTTGPSFKVGDILAAGVNLGDDNFGLSFGLGIGAAVSVIGTNNVVFATNFDDMEKFEDTYNEAASFANENNGTLKTRLDFSKEGQVSVMFDIVDEEGNALTVV